MATEPLPEHGADQPRDRDLYCPECNYNLRGLSGDPVRCPECGGEIPMSRATAIARSLRDRKLAQVRREIEGGPSLCALATGGAAFLYGLSTAKYEPLLSSVWDLAGYVCGAIGAVGLIATVVHWWGLQGTVGAFLRYQLFAVPAVIGNCLLVFGAFVVVLLLGDPLDLPPCALLLCPAAGAVVVFVFRPLRLLANRASAELEPLVEVAMRSGG